MPLNPSLNRLLKQPLLWAATLLVCGLLWWLLGARASDERVAAAESNHLPSAGQNDANLVQNQNEPNSAKPGPESGNAALPPSPGLKALIDFGQTEAERLDFAQLELDVELLLALRSLVRASGLRAADCLNGATEFSLGDPRGLALILASAWALKPDASSDGILSRLALDTAADLGPGEQAALAAVHALDLGGRRDALQQLSAAALRSAYQEPDSGGDLPGLFNLRAWLALRSAEGLDATVSDLELEHWLAPQNAQERVSEALWAAAVSRSSAWATAAAERAAQGDRFALGGIEALPATALPEHLPLLDAPRDSAHAVWLSQCLWRARLARPDANLTQDLAAELLQSARPERASDRESLLESLRSFPSPDDPRQLLDLGLTLEGDPEAQFALAQGFDRWARRTLLTQGADSTGQLRQHLLSIPPQSRLAPFATRWLSWLSQ